MESGADQLRAGPPALTTDPLTDAQTHAIIVDREIHGLSSGQIAQQMKRRQSTITIADARWASHCVYRMHAVINRSKFE
jgi:hypothetical protein